MGLKIKEDGIFARMLAKDLIAPGVMAYVLGLWLSANLLLCVDIKSPPTGLTGLGLVVAIRLPPSTGLAGLGLTVVVPRQEVGTP